MSRLSAADMEASRLIFVSVKGAVPRRKVAVPVPDSYTWEAFLDQVCARLKLSGVSALYLSATGERVTSLECLQDIDELVAVDVACASDGGAGAASSASAAARARSGGVAGPSHQRSSPEIGPADGGNGYGVGASASLGIEGGTYDDDGGDRKYAPRRGIFERLVGRLFPRASSLSSSASGLPLTRQEADPAAGGPGGKRARGRRAGGAKEALRKRSRRRCKLLAAMLVLGAAAFFFANFMYGPGGAARLAREVEGRVEGVVGRR